MKSHPRNADQRALTFVLFGASLGPTRIHAQLCEEFRDPVSLKTVKNWLADFRQATKDSDGRESEYLKRCELFTWSDIGQYEIPSEASNFIAKLMVEHVEIHKRDKFYRRLTRFEVSWLWRFHLLAPTLPISRLLSTKDRVWLEQLRTVMTGEPIDFDDIYWWLAYSPWETPEKQEIYDAAVARHRDVRLYDDSVLNEKASDVGRLFGSAISSAMEGYLERKHQAS